MNDEVTCFRVLDPGSLRLVTFRCASPLPVANTVRTHHSLFFLASCAVLDFLLLSCNLNPTSKKLYSLETSPASFKGKRRDDYATAYTYNSSTVTFTADLAPKMARKRSSAPKRQTKINFSPSAKSSTTQTTPTKTMGSRGFKPKRQSKIDIHNIAPKGTPKQGPKQAFAYDSSEDELQADILPVRAKSNGIFGSSDVDAGEQLSSSDSQSDEGEPVKKQTTRASRKRQREESSDEEATVSVIQRKRARQAESEEDDEELRVPGKRQRVARRPTTPEESEEDVHTPPRSTRRRLTKRPATPDNEEEEEAEQTQPRSTRRRARRQHASSNEEDDEEGNGSGAESGDAEEQEELKEELAFLRSSPLPDRGRLRSTSDKPKNKRQEALEALKRRRAGSVQEPSSTPARKTRTVIDSDSESELEIIKEEPDSDEVGDPESPVEDDDEDDEDDREANALDMFQEDEDDTGFIDDDPDAIIGEPDDEQAQLPMQFSSMSRAKPKELFKYAVEWMVMKKIHPAFNANDEIYELTFRKLGDEVKGLASSKFTSAAWTSDFTKAINARPELIINEIGGSRREFLTDHCEACNRKNHPATFELSLTGQPYNPESLEPLGSSSEDSDSESDSDSSLSADSEADLNGEKPTRDFRGDRIPPASKTFTLGSTCKANAQVAHTLHHWRYHLNDWVKGWLESNGYLTPEKLVKRDKKSDRKREKEARKIVDEMESSGEIRKLHSLYRDQVRFAVEAVNDFKRGWGRR